MHLFGFALHCFSRIVLHSLDLYNYAFVAYCEMTPNIWRCFVFRLLYVTGLWMVCASTAPLVIERFVATLKASSYEHHGCALGMAMVVLQFSLAATPTLTTFLNFNLNESRSYCLAVKPGVVSNSERIYATNFAVQIIARIAFHYLFKINKNLRKEQMTTSLSNRYSLEQNLKSVRMLKMFANLQSIFMIIHTTSFLLLIQFGTQIAKSTYFSLVELNAQYPLYAIVSISFLLKEMHVNRVKLRKKLEVHVLTDQAVYFENFKKFLN
uniref:Uncharacterized protein n=1 Tax=Caenorhabditis japonica TaxID=281687 RepID=A0A8R1EGF7_CAEJA